MLQKEIKVQSNRAIKRPNLPPLLFNNYTLHTRYEGADFTRQVRCNILKNSEICTKEGAVCSTNSTAPFLRRIVINLCLSIEIAEAEDEKFGVVDAVEFSPERLDFGID